MTESDQSTVRNRLLAGLTPQDFAMLAPHLEPIDLPRRTVLTVAGERATHAWFFEEGLASIVAGTKDGIETEVCMAGRDGMVDVSTVLQADNAPFNCFMQIGGSAFRMPADVLADFADTRPTLRRHLLRYAQATYVQTAYGALANATHSVEERLARWLLMSLDRMDDPLVPLTHEFLSLMLAVRRPSVTVALHVLEGERWIRAKRGLITVIDRVGLEDFAGETYTAPARELERLLADAPEGALTDVAPRTREALDRAMPNGSAVIVTHPATLTRSR